jgi:hypothetical protein
MGNASTKNKAILIMDDIILNYSSGSYIVHRANQFLKQVEDMNDDYFLSEADKEKVFREDHMMNCNDLFTTLDALNKLCLHTMIDNRMKEHDDISILTNHKICSFDEDVCIHTFKNPLSVIQIMILYDIIGSKSEYCKKHHMYASNLIKITKDCIIICGCSHKIIYTTL